MLLITATNVFAIVIFVVILFFAARWFNTPKAGTRSLVMTVWATFGPYRTVEDAEDMFRRASRAVFGQQGIGKQEKWIEDYIQSFHDWQTKGRFDRAQKIIRAGVMLTAYGKAYIDACKTVKEEAIANTIDGLINKDVLKERSLDRWQETIEACKEAIRIKPDDAFARNYLGVVYSSLGRWQEAIEAFEQTIRIKPDDEGAHYYLGVAYLNLGRWQEAIDAHKQAIGIKPDDAGAHYGLGNAYDGLGRYQDAVEAYKQAIRFKPDDAGAHYNLGNAYLNLGHYQDAVEAYKRAIRFKPDLADAHNNLGVSYFATGDKGSALEEYEILKTLDAEKANELFKWIYK